MEDGMGEQGSEGNTSFEQGHINIYNAVKSALPPNTPFVVVYVDAEDSVSTLGNLSAELSHDLLRSVSGAPLEEHIVQIGRDC
jgi:hypothetical protein